jgi:DeoR/GlpR family transcriptional regulator of sugar metabolism
VLHRQARPDLTVVLTGGVRTPSDALVGPIAVTALGSLHVDLLFMGVHGMTVDSGFTTPNLLEAETNRALIASAEQLAVVVDHTKWDVRGLSRMAQLGEAQLLITDDGLAPDAQTVLTEHVGRLVVAPTGR